MQKILNHYKQQNMHVPNLRVNGNWIIIIITIKKHATKIHDYVSLKGNMNAIG